MSRASELLSLIEDDSQNPGLSDLARAALDEPDLSDREALDLWLADDAPAANRELALAALLFQLSVRPGAFVEQPGRNLAFRFFDATLEGPAYRILKLSEKSASHEKELTLSAIVPKAQAEVAAAISDFGDLAGLHSLRNVLFRALRSPANSAALAPFLPPRLTKSSLATALDLADEVAAAQGSDLIASCERALEAISHLEADVAGAETSIAAKLLSPLVVRLRALVSKTLEESPYSEPALLSVDVTDKKYPLHSESASLRLQLRLRNQGRGEAAGVEVTVDEAIGLVVTETRQRLGTIEPGEVTVPIHAALDDADGIAMLSGAISWTNFDGRPASQAFSVEFQAQSPDVPWDELVHETPYALEPVTQVNELVGRTQIVNGLVGLFSGRSMGNAFVTGQKRVGKTSIAKTVRGILNERAEFTTVYLEIGDYSTTDPKDTPASLGAALCNAIKESDPRFSQIEVPDFSTGLAQIREFFGAMRTVDPKVRILIVLDEFDDLPVTLYRLSPLANALFSTLRTLAGRENIGFILVGGERINAVIAAQGEALNKFEQFRIDYLDRAERWGDFTDLVRLPVREWGLDIGESAVQELYGLTAGHPFFTKLICKSMFEQMRELRDASATANEVQAACKPAIERAGAHSFQHFWRDGILDEGERVEVVSARRAKVLLALAQAIGADRRDTEAIVSAGIELGLTESEVRADLLEFAQRDVLVESAGQWRCKVRFFERWLLERGISQISTQYADEDAVVRYATARLEAQVDSDEIEAVIAGWGPYRNVPRSVDHVRSWLAQFGGPQEQRAVFPILEGLEFHSGASLRAAMKEAHGIARMHTTHQLEDGKRKRNDFVVSYLDGAGKSGARFAHLYVDTNGIYSEQAVASEAVQAKLNDGVHSLIFVDDFIGTGGSIVSGLEMIVERCGKRVKQDGFQIVVVAVTGFADARDVVLKAADSLEITVRMHVCRPMTDRDRVFGAESRFYANPDQREAARLLVTSAGERLVKRAPLGYKNGQAAVVFDDACPNLSLPVLWERGKGGNPWTPLFPRFASN